MIDAPGGRTTSTHILNELTAQKYYKTRVTELHLTQHQDHHIEHFPPELHSWPWLQVSLLLKRKRKKVVISKLMNYNQRQKVNLVRINKFKRFYVRKTSGHRRLQDLLRDFNLFSLPICTCISQLFFIALLNRLNCFTTIKFVLICLLCCSHYCTVLKFWSYNLCGVV